eukprot:Hpha_TRINITY_DN3623_c0_g1::TRINITY_DN3623_c0_g1_i1::g.1144::m.1144
MPAAVETSPPLPSIYEPARPVRAPGVSVALHFPDLAAVEGYADEVGMGDQMLRCDLTLRPEQQVEWCATAAKSGKWFVVQEPGLVQSDALRRMAQEVLALPSTSISSDFIFWLVCGVEELERLPMLLRVNTLSLHAPLVECVRGRLLAQAMEQSNLFQVVKRRGDVNFLSASDRVEMLRRCQSEEIAMVLLGAGPEEELETPQDTAFVKQSYDAQRRSLLDVALVKDWKRVAARLRDLGGRSECLDPALVGQESFLPMLEVLLERGEFPFSALDCVREVAAEGNTRVLRLLFGARVDRDFDYDSYPLVHALRSGSGGAAQAIVDRLECVGLHPFRDARIALHFLRGIFTPSSGQEEIPPLDISAMYFAGRCADCILDDGACPYDLPPGCITILVSSIKAEAIGEEEGLVLLRKMLRIADTKYSPEKLLPYYLDYSPNIPEARTCLSHFMELTAERGGNIDNIRGEVLRELMFRGPSHLSLFELALSFTGADISLVCPDERMRTPLHQCFELPGFPEACDVVLACDKNPDARNDAGLNCLQQAVVDMAQDILPYIEHMSAYARLFASVIAAGVQTAVFPPEFATSLFGLCARAELAPLCYELLSPSPHINLILACSDNLLASLVSYRRQVLRAARPPGAEPFALDKRQDEARPDIAWDLPHSIVPFDDASVTCLMSFLPRKDLACGLGATCARYYLLSLHDELWAVQQRHWEHTHDQPRFGRGRVCSAKLHHHMHLSAAPLRRWVVVVGEGEELYQCLLTGERVRGRPPAGYILPPNTRDPH